MKDVLFGLAGILILSVTGANAQARMSDVTDKTFNARVLQSPKPVLVVFWANWCGPCRILLSAANQVSPAMAARVTMVRVDVDQNSGASTIFGINSLPTVVIFKNGRLASRMPGGAANAQDWKQRLEQFIASGS